MKPELRWAFCHLAGASLKDTKHGDEEHFTTIQAVLRVAEALGLKEEARQAGKIFSGLLSADSASIALGKLIDAAGGCPEIPGILRSRE